MHITGSRTSESNPKTIKSVKQDTLSRDEDLVFVAGATGRVGSRTVRLCSAAFPPPLSDAFLLGLFIYLYIHLDEKMVIFTHC